MITKAQALLMAQNAANRSNAPMAVLNLNPFGAMYVVREWDSLFAGSKDLVARVEPQTKG